MRTVTPAQRRVLTARDKGCVIPACLVPATGCQAHHVRWWRHGGGTDLENLVLICTQHHSAVHTGVWKLAVIDHVPWAIPPPWLDPQQHPRRNTLHDQLTRAQHLGDQLQGDQPTLPFEDDEPGPDPPARRDTG